MATKKQELRDGCFAKANEDEPLFVLRAQDILAPEVVRQWATTYMLHKKNQGLPWEEKFLEAMKLAQKMEKWPNRKMPD